MKLKQINYDDLENIRSLVVTIKKDEAIALVNLLGALNSYAQKKLHIDSDMFDCLSNVFNKEYEDGCPKLKHLEVDMHKEILK